METALKQHSAETVAPKRPQRPNVPAPKE